MKPVPNPSWPHKSPKSATKPMQIRASAVLAYVAEGQPPKEKKTLDYILDMVRKLEDRVEQMGGCALFESEERDVA